MPVLTFNECDYSCEGKHGGRGFRVYCRRVDPKCKVGSRIKQPWEMTRVEFMANPPVEVDIYLQDYEGKFLAPIRGKIGQTVDITGEITKGYRIANTITPFAIAHRNIVKFALQEGKPVPAKVMQEYSVRRGN